MTLKEIARQANVSVSTVSRVINKKNTKAASPEVQERIFIPFFTTKPTGSGIGLTISRQIMHQHHGSITVQSKVGEGSMFTLLFPIV